MAVAVIGVSLQPAVLASLDRMADDDGLARSAMLGRLIEEEQARRKSRRSEPLEVVVGGVRYVPQRSRRTG